MKDPASLLFSTFFSRGHTLYVSICVFSCFPSLILLFLACVFVCLLFLCCCSDRTGKQQRKSSHNEEQTMSQFPSVHSPVTANNLVA
jgi:type III secretory pathway component EscV